MAGLETRQGGCSVGCNNCVTRGSCDPHERFTDVTCIVIFTQIAQSCLNWIKWAYFPYEMQTSIIFVLKGFLCKTVVVTVVIVTATTDWQQRHEMLCSHSHKHYTTKHFVQNKDCCVQSQDCCLVVVYCAHVERECWRDRVLLVRMFTRVCFCVKSREDMPVKKSQKKEKRFWWNHFPDIQLNDSQSLS